MWTFTAAILAFIALVAVYVLGWRHGFAAGDYPRRRNDDDDYGV